MYCYFLLFKIVLIITTFLCQAFGFMARLSSSQHIFWFSLDLFCDHIHYKNPWWGSRGPKIAILKFANCRLSVLSQLRNWLLFGTYQGPWTNISSSAKCYFPIPCPHHLDLRENIKIYLNLTHLATFWPFWMSVGGPMKAHKKPSVNQD